MQPSYTTSGALLDRAEVSLLEVRPSMHSLSSSRGSTQHLRTKSLGLRKKHVCLFRLLDIWIDIRAASRYYRGIRTQSSYCLRRYNKAGLYWARDRPFDKSTESQ